MRYPYGQAQFRRPGGASGASSNGHSRSNRRGEPSAAHELAALPKLTRVGKPPIVPLAAA